MMLVQKSVRQSQYPRCEPLLPERKPKKSLRAMSTHLSLRGYMVLSLEATQQRGTVVVTNRKRYVCNPNFNYVGCILLIDIVILL